MSKMISRDQSDLIDQKFQEYLADLPASGEGILTDVRRVSQIMSDIGLLTVVTSIYLKDERIGDIITDEITALSKIVAAIDEQVEAVDKVVCTIESKGWMMAHKTKRMIEMADEQVVEIASLLIEHRLVVPIFDDDMETNGIEIPAESFTDDDDKQAGSILMIMLSCAEAGTSMDTLIKDMERSIKNG